MTVKSQHKITHQQADGKVFIPFEKVWEVDSDAAVSNLSYLPIEPGSFIYGVSTRVTETLAGGTPALLVGDSSADDKFVQAADTAETAGDEVYEAVYKYYSASDYIKVTWQASHTAGKIQLRVLFSGYEADAASPPAWMTSEQI